MRYSGVSLGYQVTAIFAGSLAPIIAVRLLEIYDSWVPIALYLAGAAVVTLIAVLFTRETKGIDLAEVDRADARPRSSPAGRRTRQTDPSQHADEKRRADRTGMVRNGIGLRDYGARRNQRDG